MYVYDLWSMVVLKLTVHLFATSVGRSSIVDDLCATYECVILLTAVDCLFYTVCMRVHSRCGCT